MSSGLLSMAFPCVCVCIIVTGEERTSSNRFTADTVHLSLFSIKI